MKKRLFSLLSFIALALLAAGVSHSSERLATSQPIDSAAEAAEPTGIPPYCVEKGKNCDLIDDDCGGKIDCGRCTPPDTCGGSDIPNVCGCTPKTCAGHCGEFDPGCGRAKLNCGGCTDGKVCIAGSCRRSDPDPDHQCPCGGRWPNACRMCSESAKTPALCAERGKNCGVIDDGHGKTVNCGTCTGKETCGGSGVPNVCGGPRKKK